MKDPKLTLVGAWSGNPHLDIWVEENGYIGFTPIDRTGWNFVSGMLWRRIIDHTFIDLCLALKYRKRIKAGIAIPREAANKAVLKLAKRLTRKKFNFGGEMLVAKVEGQ